jgi:hypothetical protein
VDDLEEQAMFRGSEKSRLLLLVAIAVAGWAIVWVYLRTPSVRPEPPSIVAEIPPLQPDVSPEFETVSDKTPMGFRDSAAYEKLLRQARDASAADLGAQARRDVQFAQLLDKPKNYRGVLLHILGSARRILRYESKLSRTGWLYEAWVVTEESQNHPWVCVFEEAPKGMPFGSDVTERVVFNGYFLKLMAYEAGDKKRMAPLLVGRIGWSAPTASGPDRDVPLTTYFAAAVACLFLISLVRWILSIRRTFASSPIPSILRDRPTEEIAPDALTAWLDTVADEDADAEDPGGEPESRSDRA